MNCKNCGTKLVLLAGVLLVISLLFPNGPGAFMAKPEPVVVPVAPVVEHATNDGILTLLADATPEDKARIDSVYTGLARVLTRDNSARVNTTEQLYDIHANTLQLAIEKPGVYTGLDVAIERLFDAAIESKDVNAKEVQLITPDMLKKIVDVCETIASSARQAKPIVVEKK